MGGLTFILKGFIIGITVSIPIGPIMMLTVQKCVNDGHKSGFSCGLGATIVDTVCAVISSFALSAIGKFIEENTAIIEIIGGLFITGVGVNMLLTRIKDHRSRESYSTRNTAKAAAMGFSNPAALAVMLAVFASFKMDMSGQPGLIPLLTIVAVSAGSAGYWYMISRIIAHFGDKFNFKVLLIINRLAGIGVILFGLYLIIKGITL